MKELIKLLKKSGKEVPDDLELISEYVGELQNRQNRLAIDSHRNGFNIYIDLFYEANKFDTACASVYKDKEQQLSYCGSIKQISEDIRDVINQK